MSIFHLTHRMMLHILPKTHKVFMEQSLYYKHLQDTI